ncbi:hypothetical protein [Halomonas sp. Mc5H-6]|uniref:hypothetical protein n=1 Tax=Halomonas sp. Mc5H-6 TaxID=2954500 RepID=UPI002096D5D6|nr:hypothetical protein [Halomonas sp. Mc5H-6]MCO7245848.1 hypothetical protein [Halomonas sp. Mc5H-6]
MEPLHTYNISRLLNKSASIVFVVAASFSIATVPAKANGSWENYQEANRIAQHNFNTDITAIQGNISIIKQNGNDNQASVIQSRSSSYQLGNFAYIDQRGENNQGSISQYSGRNIGIIVQVGNNHTADIVQEGNNFQAQINQFGFNSDISLSQSGSGQKSISVDQRNFSGNARPVTIDTY